MNEPAYLKMTASVRRGLRYAVAALEIDAIAEPLQHADGTPVVVGTNPDDLIAASAWLRYEMKKRGGES
jgi:hypothetical protein